MKSYRLVILAFAVLVSAAVRGQLFHPLGLGFEISDQWRQIFIKSKIHPKQVCISLLILLFFSLRSYSQKLVASHTQDAETGEALSYVSIYAGDGRGTLSNSDGNFTIAADANDTIRISCVGYL